MSESDDTDGHEEQRCSIESTPHRTDIVATGDHAIERFVGLLRQVWSPPTDRDHIRAVILHPDGDNGTPGLDSAPGVRGVFVDDDDDEQATADGGGGEPTVGNGIAFTQGTLKYEIAACLYAADEPITAAEIHDRTDIDNRGSVAGTLSNNRDVFAHDRPESGSAGFYSLSDAGRDEFERVRALED